jgi:hypothetical protein
MVRTILPRAMTMVVLGVAAMSVSAGAVAPKQGSGGASRGGASRVGPREAAQVTRNDRADVTVETRPALSGNGISLIARSGDLLVSKTVQPNGDFVLEIGAGDDKLTIAATPQGATITRGKTTVDLRRPDQSEAVAAKARRLLAESNAIVKFRAMAARLMEGEDRSNGALALILGDATIGLLAGDPAAPRRVARFLVERRLRNARPAGMAIDCFTLMETRFVEAWNEYGSCYYSTAYNTFYQYLCSWRWTFQVESYWFNFLSCTGFNF